MTDSSLQTLLSTKAALDLGLISQADFDAVKNSFLRAQQIKAAVDVGLIKDQDYESAKQEYLGSLVGGAPPAGAGALYQPHPVARAQPNGSGIAAVPAQQQQQKQAPPPAAAPRPPVPPAVPPPVAPPAPAPAAPRSQPTSSAPSRSGSAGTLTAADGTLPANIPKMGGSKTAASGSSMSGITVSEDAVNLYYLMRLKSTYKWALWQIDEAGTTVVIAAVGEKGSSYADFLAAIPDSDCRYGVFDYQYTTPDGQQLSKLVFLNWAPDSARVKSKMMYASTKDFFKQMLDGISVEFQASELDEIQEDEVAAAVKALKRS